MCYLEAQLVNNKRLAEVKWYLHGEKTNSQLNLGLVISELKLWTRAKEATEKNARIVVE